jgi:hypothetical protein
MESSQYPTGTSKRRDNQLPSDQDDRRSQPRADDVLSRIEDATYAILRQHEKKSA